MRTAARTDKRRFFARTAPLRDRFDRRNRYYHHDLRAFYCFHIPPGSRVLELGCGKGDLLAAVKPSCGVGVDFCERYIQEARRRHPECRFIVANVEDLPELEQTFDYVILSDLLENLDDVQSVLSRLRPYCHPGSRLICNSFSNLWEPVLNAGEWLGLKMPTPAANWLSMADIENLFYLSGFETVSRGYRMLFPRDAPLVSYLFNHLLAKAPFARKLCLTQWLVARPQPSPPPDWETRYSVSIVIPARNEAGNIPGCFTRMPEMGKWTELIFVDGNSTDGTVEAIEAGIEQHGQTWRRALLIPQGDGVGKGDAVRKGFAQAEGDILMILDSDLTMPPEDLPKFYEAIATGRGEFINGCRLVYPMKDEAMRTINYFGNKTFSLLFSWLLDQRIKDTLCGTKVLWREDYWKIAANRGYFGGFDPFGDFDLIFGAAKLGRKIVDLPIRYRERVYGDTKISRWKHAALLFRMCGVAFKRLKLQ